MYQLLLLIFIPLLLVGSISSPIMAQSVNFEQEFDNNFDSSLYEPSTENQRIVEVLYQSEGTVIIKSKFMNQAFLWEAVGFIEGNGYALSSITAFPTNYNEADNLSNRPDRATLVISFSKQF
jgi:hypothetical protein